ncbi:MAG: DUF255 domain-containing protein [Planctomycetota bacterium]|nr:DUF255 domain-containing protein [Planctomycetota bacterium]
MSNFFRLPIAILLLITASSVQAEINWHLELREAHSVAKNQNKPILLHFYADDCVWCEKLERGALASPEVAEAIHANFVPVKIHANSSPTLARMFKVDKFPSDVIVTTTGDTMSHSVSPQDVSRYLEMLQKAILVEPTASTPTIDSPTIDTNPAPNLSGMVNPMESERQVPESSATLEAEEPVDHGHVAYANLGGKTTDELNQKTQLPHEVAPPDYATLENPVYNPQMDSSHSSSQLESVSHSTQAETAFTLPTEPTTTSGDPPGENGAPASESNGQSEPPTLALPSEAIQSPNGDAAESPEQGSEQLTMPSMSDPANSESTNHTTGVTDVATATANELQSQSSSVAAPKLALEGFCAVTVIQEDQWIEGDPKLSVIHLGRLYLFANEEKRDIFLSNPIQYTPVLNEIDPVVFFEERRIVPGKREWGMKDPVHQRMFFFADEASMNHFYKQHERYTQSAIDLMEQAIKQSHPDS